MQLHTGGIRQLFNRIQSNYKQFGMEGTEEYSIQWKL